METCCSPASSAIARVLMVWSSYGTVPRTLFAGVLVIVSLVMMCPFRLS